MFNKNQEILTHEELLLAFIIITIRNTFYKL